ncbi:amidohydrolase family protein [Mycobacterium colombiense]|uniref:amidohydrolase family protein n=1 Tax=Mycobacterium colombiense TaxID=339268 RepID=UPI003AF72613
MAVRDGVVAWLGSDEVGRGMFPDADVEDLRGGFVAPGFVDSHIHLTATGLTLSGLDLRSAASRAQCLQMVAEYAAAGSSVTSRRRPVDASVECTSTRAR